MNTTLKLADAFGPRLADGSFAAQYRTQVADPALRTGDNLVLDFTGIRIANSSFVNALVAGLIEQHGESVLEKMTFQGCTPVIRVLIESAIALGLEKSVAVA